MVQDKKIEIKSKNVTVNKILKQCLAITFWLYYFIKLYVFDLDVYLFQNLSPNYEWIIKYKFFIIIGIVSVIFLFTKNKQLILFSLYILFYPLILIWNILFFIFKDGNWNLIIAFIDSVISFFTDSKKKFIKTSLFLISVLLILTTKENFLLWFSIISILIIMFLAYLQKIMSVFKPSKVNAFYSSLVTKGGNLFRDPPVKNAIYEKSFLEINKLNNSEIQNWVANIQILVFFNRLCLFFAKKLKSYQSSRFNIIFSIFSSVLLMSFTILSFSFINLGLYKISSTFFKLTLIPSFFDFFYYSFNNLLFNSIPEIIAATPISKTFSIIEMSFAIFLVGILITLNFSVKNEKEKEELSSLIENLSSEGTMMEDYLKDKYQFHDIEEVIAILRQFNAFFADFIYKISELIK